uniref:Transthyretin-like family protein n=1 Tax=Panagrolaimus davidi TaxID=227884 RepID=A0A914PNT5_9BILA
MKTAIVFLALIASVYTLTQTITLNGFLYCNSEPADNVLVELREKDTFEPDDTLSTNRSNYKGFFQVTGSQFEVFRIRPYLRVIHKCNVKDKNACHRHSDYAIPSYIYVVYQWKDVKPFTTDHGTYSFGSIDLNKRKSRGFSRFFSDDIITHDKEKCNY